MTYIDLNVMAFQCAGENWYVPFEPALSSYSAARERVVEMDQLCRKSLSRSEITVKEFVPPTGFYLLEFLASFCTFIAFSQRWWFAKGGPVEGFLGAGFAAFSWKIQPWLITIMFAIHATEFAFFIPKFLKKYSVNPRTRVWWLWAASSFIEGQFGWMRFNAHVDRKLEQKRKQKH
jgi:hypothetical protein